jgi:hypothetical protein
MYERYSMASDLFDDLEAAGLEDLDLEEDDENLDEFAREEFGLDEDAVDFAEVLRGSLVDDYEDALPEELDEALLNIFDSLTPAESFNFGKALSQIEKGAAQALADPTLRQIAGTALPVAGGAVGTYFGGPAGTAVGSSLGSAVAKAMPKSGKAGQPALQTVASAMTTAQPATGKPLAAAGSSAATQALVLTQQPDVLKSLLALALGEHGRKSVDGVSVGAVMNLLSSVFGQAAADADELNYMSEAIPPPYMLDAEGHLSVDPAAPTDRAQALYAGLLSAESDQLLEATRWG